MGNYLCCDKRYESEFSKVNSYKEILKVYVSELKRIKIKINALETHSSYKNSRLLRFYVIFHLKMEDLYQRLLTKNIKENEVLKEWLIKLFFTLDDQDEEGFKSLYLLISSSLDELC